MSVKLLLKSPPDSWETIKVQTLDSVGDITTKSIVETPILKLDSQAIDPLIPPAGSSELYYNNATATIRYYNTTAAAWQSLSTTPAPVGAECVYRLNVNPVSNPDPLTGGLIVASGSTHPAPGTIFNVPLTGLPQGLGIANPTISDVNNLFTFTEPVNNDRITCNVTGDYYISFNLISLSNLATPNNFAVGQLLPTGGAVFTGPPALDSGQAFFSDAGSPIAPFYNIVAMASNAAVVHLTAGDILSLVYYLQSDSAVISLTSNLSISVISPVVGPQGATGPAGPPATTIYNGDSSLTAARTVTTAGHTLTFTDAGPGAMLVLNPGGSTVSVGNPTLTTLNINSSTTTNINSTATTVIAGGTTVGINTPLVNLVQAPGIDNTLTDLLARDGVTGNLKRIILSSIHPALANLTVCGDGTTSTINANNGVWNEYDGAPGDTTVFTNNNSELPFAVFSVAGANNRIAWGGVANYLNITISGNFYMAAATGNLRVGIMKNGANPVTYNELTVSAVPVPFTVNGVISATTGDFFAMGIYNNTGALAAITFQVISVNVSSTELF